MNFTLPVISVVYNVNLCAEWNGEHLSSHAVPVDVFMEKLRVPSDKTRLEPV